MFTGNNSKQDQFVHQQMNYNETQYVVSSIFDLNVFPPLLRNVILSLHIDTQVSIDLITSAVLAATSLAYQPLIKVVPPHSAIPEPCSLYFLTLAESGSGKTTIHKLIMKPFYDYLTEMKKEYDIQLNQYKRKWDTWKTKKQALDNNLRKSIRNNINTEWDEKAIENHLLDEPQKPQPFHFIYEDTTPKALLDGLGESPDAGLVSDEAITFFKGYIKNNYGILNKAWDGDSYLYHRAEREPENIKANLTISLMAQPTTFNDYLKKHGEQAKGSGFLSRFLFVSVNTKVKKNHQVLMLEKQLISSSALTDFHEFIKSLLKKRQCNNYQEKIKTLQVNQDLIKIYEQIRTNFLAMSTNSGVYENISDITSKANSNILRLAALFHNLNKIEGNELTYDSLNNALSVISSYIQQANELFYPMSEQYQLAQDARELFSWIKSTLNDNGWQPFNRSEIKHCGPNRLRKSTQLEQLLNIIVTYTDIKIIQKNTGGPLRIMYCPQSNMTYSPPVNQTEFDIFVQPNPSIHPNGIIPIVDFSGL